MGTLVLVDETKRRGYVMVACHVAAPDAVACRSALSRLLLPGQARLHMNSERDSRRRLILSTIARCPVRTLIYVAEDARDGRRARTSCLSAIVDDAPKAARFVIDRDDSVTATDRRLIARAIVATAREATTTYEHRRGREEPLLALPDAIAWAWARGDDWRRRAGAVTVRRI